MTAALGDQSLAGTRVHVLRGGPWGASVAARIRERGGVARMTELLRIAPADPEPLGAAAEAWNRGEHDLLVVTSANGADAFADAGGQPRSGGRVAAVGPATAAALRQRGFAIDVLPESVFSASGLAEALRGEAPLDVLLPISELADDTLERALERAGHRVHRVTAYRTAIVAPGADPFGGSDATPGGAAAAREVILITSASAARAVAEHLQPLPSGVVLAAIGDPSARELDRLGLHADVVAPTHTIPGLLDALGASLPDLRPIPTEGPQT